MRSSAVSNHRGELAGKVFGDEPAFVARLGCLPRNIAPVGPHDANFRLRIRHDSRHRVAWKSFRHISELHFAGLL